MKKHPGLKSVQKSIAKKEGISTKAAGAILASSSRKASAKAKESNPRRSPSVMKTKRSSWH